MGDTTDIRKGAVIRHQGDLFVVSGFQFVNPGKGSAFTKTKMKSISSEKSIEVTYKSGESVDTVQVDHVNMQYLYTNGDFYSFMNQSTYETVDVNKEVLGEDAQRTRVLAVDELRVVVRLESFQSPPAFPRGFIRVLLFHAGFIRVLQTAFWSP